MKKRLKINGILIFCSFALIAFFPRFFLRSYYSFVWDEVVEVIGFGLILFGQIIRVSARGYKAENSSKSRSLIQGGPYRIVRNPMYLGIFLIGLGVVLAVFKWWTAGIFILIFIIRYILLIYKEEKKLLKNFPGEYQQYCKRVPRIFPYLPDIVKLDISEYLPIKIEWFKKEVGSIVTLILLVLLVESWEDILKEGLITYLKQLVWFVITLVLFSFLVVLISKRTNKKNENSSGQGQDSRK